MADYGKLPSTQDEGLDCVPLVYDIQRFSIQDGPGARTTLFIKGCPLRCPWCHNPETQTLEREILLDTDKCVGCGKCAAVCPTGATYFDGEGLMHFDRAKCTRCGKCVNACPPEARTFCGEARSFQEILKRLLQDELFYLNSGGGVTISGGDPMLFPHFTRDILKEVRANCINTAIETSAFCQWRYLEEIVPYVNTFLVDFKTPREDKYRDVIHADINVVKRNFENLLSCGAYVRARLPIIPGFNNSQEDFEGFAEYLGFLRTLGLAAADILPFHSYASKKYQKSGRWDGYQFQEIESLQTEDVLPLARLLAAKGFSSKDDSLTVGGLFSNK